MLFYEKLEVSVAKLNKANLKKTLYYLQRNGLRETWISVRERLTDTDRYFFVPCSEAELVRQSDRKWEKPITFSIVVPLYRTPEAYLSKMITSVMQQSYPHWELILADATEDHSVEEILKQQGFLKEQPTDGETEPVAADPRLHYVHLKENAGIAANTNQALPYAKGEYIGLLDHDDVLTPDALYEMADAIIKAYDRGVKVAFAYSDEDKCDGEETRYYEPNYKEEFNYDLILSNNYICHFLVMESKLLKSLQFRPEFDGAQDYDLVLRCVAEVLTEGGQTAEKRILHIPKVLYHWRCHEESTAENPESKTYAFESGKRAIEEHYRRTGIDAEVYQGEFLGLYRTRFHRDHDPLISIIIPNKDHIDDLKRCISSIVEKSAYTNYEIIIVENNSVEKETFVYYETLKSRYPNVRILTWKKEFNYSAINNFAVREAQGEYLLFLNNDVEIITDSWLEEMLQFCQLKGVGMVGAKLYYPDDTIQHAGVVVGLGGVAAHVLCKLPGDAEGYMGRLRCVQEMSAVTAACMMVKTSVFKAVGGFDEELKVAFNDIDLCMKVRDKGEKILFTPYAELYHYESKSRGMEDTPEKQLRFSREVNCFRRKWERELLKGDPYYNPNLTLNNTDCSLRKLERNGD